MESKMKCKVVMLDAVFTQKQNQIIKQSGNIKLPISYNSAVYDIGYGAKPQHLYLISDEEIQVGDSWYNSDKNTIQTWNEYTESVFKVLVDLKHLHKIVATTDSSLNLPLIPQSFIEKYVEVNGKIEEVMIEVIIETHDWEADDGYPYSEVISRIVKTRKDNTVIISKVKDTWNYDEVVLLLEKCWSAAINKANYPLEAIGYSKWLEINFK